MNNYINHYHTLNHPTMKTINTQNQEIDQELYGQLSHTGKPFDCGYYLSLHNGTFYFANGEEKQRDEFLKQAEIYDEETPNWETLHELYGEQFYYSEWLVQDDLDGGYDENGTYYLYDSDNKVFIEEVCNKTEQSLTEGDLLEHAVINQLESDFGDQDYDAMSEMLNILIKQESSKKVLIEYLGDTAKENWIEGKTKTRY